MKNKIPRYKILFEYSFVLNKSLNEKIKKENLKKEKQILNECSFHPKTNYSNFYKKKKPIKLINESLIKRNNFWNKKKQIKKTKILLNKIENENNNFKPKKNFYYKINFNTNANEIVNDPESYENYINSKKKYLKTKENKKFKDSNFVGSGNFYNGNKTEIKEFVFQTEKNYLKRNFIKRSKSNNQFLHNQFIKNYNKNIFHFNNKNYCFLNKKKLNRNFSNFNRNFYYKNNNNKKNTNLNNFNFNNFYLLTEENIKNFLHSEILQLNL